MLNMRSMRPDDLTTKAKIRNAAIELFARDGFPKTNLRAIATSAGVSAPLVLHHFGSKDGLREACDEYLLGVLLDRSRKAQPAGMSDLLNEYLADPEEYRTYVQYMVRAIEEDSPAAQTFVDTVVAEAEAVHEAGVADGSLRPSGDPRALAVLTVLISLATLTMPPALARALGHDAFGPDVLHRIGLPTLELFTHGMYTDDSTLRAAKAAWAESPSGKGE
jgi:AcrR family transcriptional regulator